MAEPRFSSLEDYYSSLERSKGDTLRSIVDFAVAEFEELEAKLAWNVPHVHRDGKYVFGVSASKSHVSVNPWSADVIQDFEDRLGDYDVTKYTVKLPVDWEIDKVLVADLVRARLAELDAE